MRFSSLATVSLLAATALAAPAVRRQCSAPAPPATTDAPEPPATTDVPPPPQSTETPPPPPTPTEQPPPPPPPVPTEAPPAAGGLTAEQLVAIDPNTASCDGAPMPGECADAAKAAPFLSASFEKYGTTSAGEMAALISLITFETGGLKYDRNHFPAPGRPGQGTRNLMMFPGVYSYATSIPEIADQVKAIAGNADAANDDQKNQIRELVLKDEYSFASAAWYLSTCSDAHREGLKSGSREGWAAYIETCVYTTVTPEREAAWSKALQVLQG